MKDLILNYLKDKLSHYNEVYNTLYGHTDYIEGKVDLLEDIIDDIEKLSK